ncbi:MAG: hypothetical protein IK036_02355 [Clostridia bacterium]|nr:hypothetical protein [Clostridia bacterium]MBR5015522.1 hypothetical protein [Clostridia bacterium]MBR5976622.1 hypothetical protein [Clostridia bacterium]MBR5991574.1 hypothetical protein [Clostridia bacterium]MBR6479552.1 hypothetical protein [Clostridia bacterium]
MSRLFKDDISPACEHCKHGRLTPDGTGVLCVKNGIMLPDSYCKSYKYDVLKRRPKKNLLIFSDYTEDDFKL